MIIPEAIFLLVRHVMISLVIRCHRVAFLTPPQKGQMSDLQLGYCQSKDTPSENVLAMLARSLRTANVSDFVGYSILKIFFQVTILSFGLLNK